MERITTPITVSDLNRQAKSLLESSLGRVCVLGELSSFSQPRSGHWYFTLKDERSQVRCAMFKGQNFKVSFTPKEGDEIVATAKVSLYEGRGDYQLIVDSIQPAGIGALQQAFDALKKKLHTEGLFDGKHKQKLPSKVRRVAIITSSTGAVIHDIISVCQKRFPLLPLTLVPVSVQGEQAAKQIEEAIARCNDIELADVIILGRGGGSLEDLWPFNEERVARAIFSSRIPIVSAIGHEVDTTIADYVADYRAPTPSAAAETLTPDQNELKQYLDQVNHGLNVKIQAKILVSEERVAHLRRRLRHPGHVLTEQKKQTLTLRNQLNQAMHHRLSLLKLQLTRYAKRVAEHNPHVTLERHQNRIDYLQQKLANTMDAHITLKQARVKEAALSLDLTSPLATLGRGYAIASKDNGVILRQAEDAKVGDSIEVKLSNAQLKCTVDQVEIN